jgi:hypothetical protein
MRSSTAVEIIGFDVDGRAGRAQTDVAARGRRLPTSWVVSKVAPCERCTVTAWP